MDKSTTRIEPDQPLLTNDNDMDNERLSPQQKKQMRDREDLNFWNVMKQICDLSVYPIVGMLFHPAYQIVNTIILGQDDEAVNNLAIFGLATVTMSIAMMSIQLSFNNALMTLVSQAHGQQEPRLCSIYLNRQLVLNVIVFIPLCILLLFAESFFLAIGQQAEIAQRASNYIRVLLPGYFCFGIFHAYQKYLAGQKEVRLSTFSYVLAFIIHLPVSYLLAVYYDMGVEGIAIASSIHLSMRLIILSIAIKFSQFNSNLVSIIDQETFRNLKPQMKMSLYSSGMLIWGWWAFDIFTFLSNFMTNDIMAAQIVCRQIVLLFYMIPIGLSIASSILVGNMIVINLINEAFVMLCLYILFDCLQCIGTGIISGLGKQNKGSLLTIFYFKMGITALWQGPLVAIAFNSVAYYAFILCVDLKETIRIAEERRLREKNHL
ncbi:na+-driven multidrug efflux pump [Stylonychia lemnae]|uniref:Na+-driven multidrug efflux pump n=1 Tax=Stylonychia lemnae TaxID=5949 RepID=A0A077ZRZ1_STYLE|nr:na+-driven multidrug efflux pump [Stylonychia lemnae]|eukprot:CDW72125.1 na+-driven multidrug efflux pump [Stylonychia lemnae]